MNVLLGAYGISYAYDGKKPSVEEVSFEIEEGEVLALLGPNGCGKSTLLKAIAGILPLRGTGRSGQIRFKGSDLLSQSTLSRARHVAYVGADLRIDFPITAREVVSLGRLCQGTGALGLLRSEDEQAVRAAMDRALCWNLRDRDVNSLSGGERQLVALARALAQGAKVLLLDEALSKMDLNHQALIGRMLRDLAREGYAVILVSHDVNLAAQWSRTALLMKAGKKIASGGISDVLTADRIRALYPGADLELGKHPQSGAPQVFFKT